MALANWYYEIWLCKDNKNKRNTESKWWGMFLVPQRIVWQIVCPDANVERHLSTTNTQGMGHENIFSSDICEDSNVCERILRVYQVRPLSDPSV